MCGCLSHAPPLGTWPETQARALAGNQTSDPLVRSLCSIHWATPARVSLLLFSINLFLSLFHHLLCFKMEFTGRTHKGGMEKPGLGRIRAQETCWLSQRNTCLLKCSLWMIHLQIPPVPMCICSWFKFLKDINLLVYLGSRARCWLWLGWWWGSSDWKPQQNQRKWDGSSPSECCYREKWENFQGKGKRIL